MPLVAESNSIKYHVDTTEIDLGCQLYDRTTEREITIWNQGKVPFDYNFNMKLLLHKSSIECLPSSGRIGPGHKESVKVKVQCPSGQTCSYLRAMHCKF